MHVKFGFETIYAVDNNLHLKGTIVWLLDPCQPSIAFYIETSHLMCSVNLGWSSFKNNFEQVFAFMDRSFGRIYKHRSQQAVPEEI